MANMLKRNEASLQALVIKQNAELEWVTNPKNGKTFFVCGKVKGYVSPAAAELLADESSTTADFQVAECSKDNGATWVPCLMVVGNSGLNVKRRLGRELLHA